MPKRQSQRLLLKATKKQKLDAHNESTTPADDLSPFEKLPEHVIEKIVNNLKFDGIKDMFLVSKCIYGILSNSQTIMSNFVLKISKVEDLQADNIRGGRKYSKIKFRRRIKGKDMNDVNNFLEPFASSIKHICFEIPYWRPPGTPETFFTKQMIEKFLLICNKVQHLEVKNFTKENRQNQINELRWKNVPPLDLPELKTLKFPRTAFRLFEMFKNCQLKSFILSQSDSNYSSKHVKDFLQTQHELEDLELNSLHNLFDDGSFTKMKFELKSLIIEDSRNFVPNETFSFFAKTNAALLTKLEIPRNLFNHFINCRHIKKLELHHSYDESYSHDFIMDSVEDITLRFANTELLAYNFPNLKKIRLFGCTIEDDFVKDLPHAEMLKCCFCTFKHALSMAKLKSIALHKSESKFIELEGNQLKELNICCAHHEWIPEFLELDDTKLKLLEISGPGYSTTRQYPELFAAIERNRHKIQRTIIAYYPVTDIFNPF